MRHPSALHRPKYPHTSPSFLSYPCLQQAVRQKNTHSTRGYIMLNIHPSSRMRKNATRRQRCYRSIYVHVIGMSPRTYHHCHSTRRGTRPSNYALSNEKRPAAALTSPMTLIHPPIHMSGKLSNVASSLSQLPSRIATEQLRALE